MRRTTRLTLRFLATAVVAVALFFPAIASAAEAVDLLLVFAVDVSRSIDQDKFQLQRDGYASAVTNPRVLEAIRSGPHHRIAVTFIEWSGVGEQRVVIDWTLISDAASAQQFASALAEAPRSFQSRTSISGAIEISMAQLDKAPFESLRRTIDISGDGTNNAGRDVRLARDEALAKGVTINGLVILSEHPLSWNAEHTNPPGGLDKYYETNVIGGPGAFVMMAQNFNSFGQAIINKMIAEIAAAGARQVPDGPRFADQSHQ
jgi:Protein of unknown function (DUF1194)